MDRVQGLLARHGLDVVIVATAVVGALGTAHRDSAPTGWLRWVEAVVVATVVLVLVLRRRLPFAAPALVWACSAGLSFLDDELVTGQVGLFATGMCAALLLGNLRRPHQARAGLAIVLAGAVVVVGRDPTQTTGNLFFVPLLFSIGWLVGFALRERADEASAAQERAARAEREREVMARVAVAEERTRIAREMHDVVAHAVSVMVLQVGAVRHRMSGSDPENLRALENVERAGRAALTEMRRLLGALRVHDDGDELRAHVGLDNLPALLDDVRAAGLDVHCRVLGTPSPLPTGIDLSAYRIVQEGLTNALKHAAAGRADVTLEYGPDGLRLEVSDDGRGDVPHRDAGHGLVGIAERVKIYGGDMSTGPGPHGGFVLRATLPVEPTPP